MQTTSHLGLIKWNLGTDPYSHLELAANWQAIDDAIFKRTGDTVTGTITTQSSSVTDSALAVKALGDSSPRVDIHPDSINFGSGTAATDIKLYRSAANTLKLDDELEIAFSGGASLVLSDTTHVGIVGLKTASTAFIQNRVLASDANPTLSILGSGEIGLGAGGANAIDTRVYRSGVGEITVANTLNATDLVATNSLTINGAAITISSGALQTSAGFVTSNIVRGRDGLTGRIQLGDAADNTKSIIYFGGAADVNLYRSAADTLKSDDSFVANKLNITGSGTGSAPNGGSNSSIYTPGDIAGAKGWFINLNVFGDIAGSNLTLNGDIATNTLPIIAGSIHSLGFRTQGYITLVSSTNSNLMHLYNENSFVTLASRAYSGTNNGTGAPNVLFKFGTDGNLYIPYSSSVDKSIFFGDNQTSTYSKITYDKNHLFKINANVPSNFSGGTPISLTVNNQGLFIGTDGTVGAGVLGVGKFYVSQGINTANGPGFWVDIVGSIGAQGATIGSNGLTVVGGTILNGLDVSSSLNSSGGINLQGGNLEAASGYLRTGGYAGPPTVANSVIAHDIVAWGAFYSPIPSVQAISDLDKKTDFVKLDSDDLLDKIKRMESLSQWRLSDSYVAKVDAITGDNTPNLNKEERFYGPSAQEFNKIFKPEVIKEAKAKRRSKARRKVDPNEVQSSDIFDKDKMINVYDMAGISLMAIQALIDKIESLETQIQKLGN